MKRKKEEKKKKRCTCKINWSRINISVIYIVYTTADLSDLFVTSVYYIVCEHTHYDIFATFYSCFILFLSFVFVFSVCMRELVGVVLVVFSLRVVGFRLLVYLFDLCGLSGVFCCINNVYIVLF